MASAETPKTEGTLFLTRRWRRLLLASIGTVITSVLLVAWVASGQLDFGYAYWPGTPKEGYYQACFSRGLVELCHGHHRSLEPRSSWFCYDEEECQWSWTPIIEKDVEPLHYSVTVALWVPFVLIAIPTAILWCPIRRRFPPHCCQQCGYDLTGNVSGICPECGAEAARIGQEDSSGPAAS